MLLDIYEWIVVITAVVSWLIAFEVISEANVQTQNLIGLLKKCTDPVFKPLSKYIPPIGGIDITPIVVIILIEILKEIIVRVIIF
jgi:YggT family protein